MVRDEEENESFITARTKGLSGTSLIIFWFFISCSIVVCCCPCLYLIFRCSWAHKGGWADTVFILLLSCILGVTGGIGIIPLILIIWFVSYLYGIKDWSCPISGRGGIKEMRSIKTGTKLKSKSK